MHLKLNQVSVIIITYLCNHRSPLSCMLLYLCNIAAVRFELGNGTGPLQILNNNSVVDILSIGDAETGGNPLVCATQFTPCCAEYFSRAGNWYYPNRTEVPVMGAGYSFYRIRRDSGNGVLGGALMNRRFGAMGPTGIYSCILLDLNGVNQTLYIGLYTSDTIQTTTAEELITTTVATTTHATSFGATTKATTDEAITEATTIIRATTEATTIVASTSEATPITGTGEATTIAATTQDTPAEVSTTEEPIITDNTTNKTNTMPPDKMQQTTEGPMSTSGDGTVIPTTEILRVICDSLPHTSESDPLLIMAIIEGVIIAILIAILTVVTVAFLHWR